MELGMSDEFDKLQKRIGSEYIKAEAKIREIVKESR